MTEAGGPRFVRHPGTLWRRTLDGVVVLAPDSETPLRITGAGHALWMLLAEPATVEELVGDLASVYGRTAAEVGADVERVLRQLSEAGAAGPVDDPP